MVGTYVNQFKTIGGALVAAAVVGAAEAAVEADGDGVDSSFEQALNTTKLVITPNATCLRIFMQTTSHLYSIHKRLYRFKL
ncbi:hypothetical protein D3C85_1529960 [compost metagenome]